MAENPVAREGSILDCGLTFLKVSENAAFPFKIGMPRLVEINEAKGQLVIKPISEKEVPTFGWQKRIRRK